MQYLLTDHLGSVVAVADSLDALVESNRYMPFACPGTFGGAVRTGVGSLTQTDKSFTSQKALANTGLMDYNARMYDPDLGRFVQPDSIVPEIEQAQAYNRYTYVLDNPIGKTDPSGNFACWDENADEPYCSDHAFSLNGLVWKPDVKKIGGDVALEGASDLAEELSKTNTTTITTTLPNELGGIGGSVRYTYNGANFLKIWGGD
jgi:RHS repeat-associated protein